MPNAAQVDAAVAAATEIFPEAASVSPKREKAITFFSAASNFESVRCPACGAHLSMDWWNDTMEGDSDGDSGFRLDSHETPCCGKSFTLNELKYDMPQAFGMFGLELMNPNVGVLPGDTVARLESLLGSRVTIVYQHL
jgi:hypothetical protein